jgi:hypothetical protein
MRRFMLAVLILGLSGCVTPVIPLPPPVYELEIDSTTQSVVMKNRDPKGDGRYANALIYFYNVRSGEGVIAQADSSGKYRTAPVQFSDLDRFELWGARFADDSPSSIVCVTMDKGEPKGYVEACKPGP